MKRVCCAVLAALLLCLSGCGVQSEPEQLSLFAMDTYMTLAAYGDKASEALAACGQELNRLDGALVPDPGGKRNLYPERPGPCRCVPGDGGPNLRRPDSQSGHRRGL